LGEPEQLRTDPGTLEKVLGFDEGPRVREVRPKGILGFLLRLTQAFIQRIADDGHAIVVHVS
jgi:hypothetical protein